MTDANLEGGRFLIEFAEDLKFIGKTRNTVDSYVRDARLFIEFLQPFNIKLHQIDGSHLEHYLKFLSGSKLEKKNSVRRSLIGIRQFFRFLEKKNIISQSAIENIPIPVHDKTGFEKLSDEDLEKIKKGILQKNSPFIASRNFAILCAIAYEGIKSTELIQLEWSDFIANEKNASLKIRGRKERIIALSENSLDALLDYKTYYDQAGIQIKTKMFISFQGKNHTKLIPHMTRHGLKFILYEIGQMIEKTHLNAENLRHHAIQYQLTQGKSPEEVRHHLGLFTRGNIQKHLEIIEGDV